MGRATLAGGCFWCLDAAFRCIDGVKDVRVGYSGGKDDSPTYGKVCNGKTGHAEAADIIYDEDVVGFKDLLKVFFSIHDPTTKDRQGNDVGSQYRSAIFHHDECQRVEAERYIKELEESGGLKGPVVTGLSPFESFYVAEEHHQDYYRRNPRSMYCRLVVAPKVAKAEKLAGSSKCH